MSYVRFYSTAIFTLGTVGNAKLWNGTASNAMEYSTNGSSWSTWTGTSAISAAATNGVYNLYLRGTGNTKVSNSSNTTLSSKFMFTGTQSIDSEGNIESLLDYQTVDNNQHPTMNTYAFACLFDNQTLLKTPPELGSTTLTNYCYYHMFDGCTSLMTAPELPATTLAESCYSYMFNRCTSLTTPPPKLPATTLTSYCYSGMFFGCTSLTTPPLKLPATTLTSNCYNAMFFGCTSLMTAPELPATTLAEKCYYSMFNRCTSLTIAPKLPATTLADYCYQNMFKECTSLMTSPSILPATALASHCYDQMFSTCTSLIAVPILPATSLTSYCYYAMFYGCTSLAIVPVLPATILTESCYNLMFCSTNIKLSTTKHNDYTLAYRIPTVGTGTMATDSLTNMFYGSGVNTPAINTTYYIKDVQYMVTESEITAIADAIRLSSNSNSSLTYPDDFIDEIKDMDSAFCYSKDSIPNDDFGNNGDLCIIS